MRNGPNGIARSEAKMDPTVVKTQRRSVARKGENKAPARTFYEIED